MVIGSIARGSTRAPLGSCFGKIKAFLCKGHRVLRIMSSTDSDASHGSGAGRETRGVTGGVSSEAIGASAIAVWTVVTASLL